MPEVSTPLSDCISQLVENNTPENYERFLQVFLESRLGVIATGALEGCSGDVVAGKSQISVVMCKTPSGKNTVLACAERNVFVRCFSSLFNAEMDASALLKTALANPACEGITVNSATSSHRAVILRSRFAELVQRKAIGPQ